MPGATLINYTSLHKIINTHNLIKIAISSMTSINTAFRSRCVLKIRLHVGLIFLFFVFV